MSESDVYRRQILTYGDGPRAERVNDFNVAIPVSGTAEPDVYLSPGLMTDGYIY